MDKGRILILDDDPAVALSCERVLGAEGFATSTSDTGRSALSLIERERFNLLISDVRLPDINGMAVLKETMATHPDMDVVMITGYPAVMDAVECMRLGAAEYIEKPFTPDRLINVVRSVLSKKGWSLRQDILSRYEEHVVGLREAGIMQREAGTWVKDIGVGLCEIGCDVRYWVLSGNLVYIDFIDGIRDVTEGSPFARILTSSGSIIELPSPVTGRIIGLNTGVNDVLTALVNHASDGWLLKLAKVAV